MVQMSNIHPTFEKQTHGCRIPKGCLTASSLLSASRSFFVKAASFVFDFKSRSRFFTYTKRERKVAIIWGVVRAVCFVCVCAVAISKCNSHSRVCFVCVFSTHIRVTFLGRRLLRFCKKMISLA